MNESHFASADLAVWTFLDELKSYLRSVSDDHRALTFSLRRTCEHFKVDEGCIAVLTPDGSRADLISVIPRGARWDLDRLAAFLQKQRAHIPQDIIIAPVNRRGRLWAALALRGQRDFKRYSDAINLSLSDVFTSRNRTAKRCGRLESPQ